MGSSERWFGEVSESRMSQVSCRGSLWIEEGRRRYEVRQTRAGGSRCVREDSHFK